jgi:subtilisin family serine protease
MKSRAIVTFSFVCGFSVFAYAQNGAVPREYIVKLKNQAFMSSLKSKSPFGSRVFIKKVFSKSATYSVKAETDEARAALLNNPDIEFIEPNYIVTVDPADPADVGQTGVPNAVINQVKESWDLERPASSSDKTIVAIIDSGIAKTHPVFSSSHSIWVNKVEKNGKAGVDDDKNGFIDDINGWNFILNNSNNNDDNDHGTHVAGIVLGVGQDIFSGAAEESKIQIMPLKFLNAAGSGATSDAIEAVYYAVDNGAKVINNSWGGTYNSKALLESFQYAESKGVVIVSAAGNANKNNDESDMFPANYILSNTISVLATNTDDSRAAFSNYGAKSVSVGAPGVAIVSTIPGDCPELGCFEYMSGTSMAAPFVSGLAVLVAREAPQLTAGQIKNVIMKSVDLVNVLSDKALAGGRVNAYRTIELAKTQAAIVGDSPANTFVQQNPNSSGSGAGCGLVKNNSQKNLRLGNLLAIITLFLFPLFLASQLKRKTAALEYRRNDFTNF